MKAPAPQNSRRQTVLGVDPGLATTGWGIVERDGSRLELKAYGAILSAARQPLPLRLRQIRSELAQLIQTYRPTVVAIEELYFTKFAVSIASTAQARGVILLTLSEHEIPLFEYNPRAVKMATTGFGSANKIQMQSMLQRHFNLKEIPRPDDAADALAIALCHLQTQHYLKVSTSRRSRDAFESEMAARAGVTR